MKKEKMQYMEKAINKIIKHGCFDNRKIVLFGSGLITSKVIIYLEELGYKIYAIVDNSKEKHGKEVLGIKIFDPNQLLKKNLEFAILITSSYYDEISKQLKNLKFKPEKDFFKIVDYKNSSEDANKLMLMVRNSIKIMMGAKYCYSILKEYDLKSDEYFIFCPIPSMGDTFYACSYLKEFLRCNDRKKAVMGVVRNSHVKIAQMFSDEIRDIVLLNEKQAECIEKFLGFYDFDSRFIVASPFRPMLNKSGSILGYKDYSFTEIFKRGIYNIKSDSKQNKPKFECDNEENIKVIEEYELVDSKSILLIPYSDSTPNYPIEFWEVLAKKLTEKGYKVFTNVSNKWERPIANTKPVFFKLSQVEFFANYFKTIISNRNGLCDVLVHTNCKIVVIYPDYKWKWGTTYSVFKLSGEDTEAELYELIFSENDQEKIQTDILNKL